MKRVVLLFAVIALGSCAGRGAAVLPAANPAGNAPAIAIRPPVITVDFIQNAQRIQAPYVLPRSLPRFLMRGPGFGRIATVGPGDKELEGIAITTNPGAVSPYTGIFAAQTAYTKQFVQIGYPSGDSGTSSLIAPLEIPPNKSCLETGQLYSNPGTGTSATFVVLNLCSGGIPFATPIDTAFSQKYTRISARGVPELISLTLTLDPIPTSSSIWYALLYNYTTGKYDLAASGTGISSSAMGLSTWLSEFVQGPCPLTPTIASDSMFLYNGATKNFEIIRPTMTRAMTAQFGSGATCFSSHQEPPYYNFNVSNPYSSWNNIVIKAIQFINEFSSGITGGSQPSGITTGPDGNLWFTEYGGNRIGRITTGGVATEFSKGITAGSKPDGITSGPDGNLWFTEANSGKIGRITTAGVVTEFSNGITLNSGPTGITSGPDGNLWFAELTANQIGRITTSGVVTEFSTGITANSLPHGITSGSDGNLWFTEVAGNQIGRITTAGVVTEFFSGITLNSGPVGIASGPDGNLWFTENNANQIGRITTAGVVTEFSSGITAGSGPFGITSGPDGNLWFTEYDGNRIGVITPVGVVSEISTGISASAAPDGIATGSDGNLWFTEFNGSRIGVVR